MKPSKIFLVIGASGVGKTTLTQKMSEKSNYHVMDMDAEIVRRHGNPNQGVADYFQMTGMNNFQLDAIEILKELKKTGWGNWNEEDILLVDMGAGSVYGSSWDYYIEEFNTILLTAYPEYLWNFRKKPKELHSNFNHFMTWQFNVPKILHETCDIVMDVSYLEVGDTVIGLSAKIDNYMKYKNQK